MHDLEDYYKMEESEEEVLYKLPTLIDADE